MAKTPKKNSIPVKNNLFLICYAIAALIVIVLFIFTTKLPKKEQLTQVDSTNAASIVLLQNNFENGLGGWILSSPTSITTTAGVGVNGSKGLVVNNPGPSTTTVATYRFASPSTGKVAVMMYDDMSTDLSYRYLSLTDDTFTRGMSFGIRPQTSATNYVYCPSIDKNGCMDTGKKRTLGWHNFKIIITPKGAYGKIDNESFSFLPANEINPAVNVNFLDFQRINLGMQFIAGKSTYDDLLVDTFPAPGTGTDIAFNMINIFLSSYDSINVSSVDQLMKARKSEFCTASYDPALGQKCPDGSSKLPYWIYEDQLFHMYGALLNTGKAHAIRYIKTGNQADLAKAILIIKYMDNENPQWAKKRAAATVSSSLNVLSHLVWTNLDATLKQSLENHLISDANFYLNSFVPYSKYIGDSGGEENVWPAAYFTSMALFFNQRPEAQTYLDRGRFFAFHSLTRGESYDGVTTRTIYDDYKLDNHDYHPHPGYVTSVVQPLTYLDVLTKRVTGKSYPEYTHNVSPVWNAMKEFVNAKSFQYRGESIIRRGVDVNPEDGIPDYFPSGNVFWPSGKSDWGTDALLMSVFRLVKESVGNNTWNDISSQFNTTDMAKHAEDSVYYLKSQYLWRYVAPGIQFSEMYLDKNISNPQIPYPESYKWFQNSNAVGDYVLYEYMFDPTIPMLSTLRPPVTPTPTPTLSPSPSPTRSPSPTPTASPSPTPTPTVSPSPSPTRSPSPSPTNSPVPTPVRTNTPVPTATPIAYGCSNQNFYTVHMDQKNASGQPLYTYTKDCMSVPRKMYLNEVRFEFFVTPTLVKDIPFIKTENIGIKDDRNLQWSVTIDTPALVYVLYRKIPGQSIPAWLSPANGYTKKTNDDFSNLNQYLLRKNELGLIGVYDIYEKVPLYLLSAGKSSAGVTFGPASDANVNAYSMYQVGIKPVQ